MPSAFRTAYERLLAGERPWESTSSGASARAAEKSNAAPRTRFLQDLLRLPVERGTLQALLSRLSPIALLDDRHAARRDNITSVWREALRVWADDAEDDEHARHALETLVGLAVALLPKTYTNYALDMVTLLAGRMSEADDTFYVLIEALDRAFQKRPPPQATAQQLEALAEEQRLALELALVWTACTGSSSLSSYTLHRDLFTSALGMARRSAQADLVRGAALLAAVLVTSGPSPEPAADAQPIHTTLQPYLRRLQQHAASPELAQFAPAFVAETQRLGKEAQAATHGAATSTSWSSWSWWSAAPVAPPPERETPLPRAASVLWAPWFWAQTSEFFSMSMLAPARGEPLMVSWLSLASYLSTYAASSPAATAQAHAALQVPYAMLELRDGRLSDTQRCLVADLLQAKAPTPNWAERVSLCRTRANPLPARATSGAKRPRRWLVPILDHAALYLKYNRSKRLDPAPFHTALGTVRRAVVLCATAGVQLEYDWLELWRAVLDTGAFLLARMSELTPESTALAPAVLDTLALTLVYSDKVLQTPAEVHWLLYELVRNEAMLTQLAPLGDASVPGAWTLLSDIFQAAAAGVESSRAARPSRISFFRHDAAHAPLQMETILRVLQSLDLESLLAPERGPCAEVARRAHAVPAARSVPVPSPVWRQSLKEDLLHS